MSLGIGPPGCAGARHRSLPSACSPLSLEMTLWRVVLTDRGGMLETFLEGLSDPMQALEDMLRWAGIDPPKTHDLGDSVLRFEGVSGHELKALAEASKELRKEREFSFCGDIDFIPTDEYDADDADTALGQARLATACLGRLLGRATI